MHSTVPTTPSLFHLQNKKIILRILCKITTRNIFHSCNMFTLKKPYIVYLCLSFKLCNTWHTHTCTILWSLTMAILQCNERVLICSMCFVSRIPYHTTVHSKVINKHFHRWTAFTSNLWRTAGRTSLLKKISWVWLWK